MTDQIAARHFDNNNSSSNNERNMAEQVFDEVLKRFVNKPHELQQRFEKVIFQQFAVSTHSYPITRKSQKSHNSRHEKENFLYVRNSIINR